MNDDKNKNAMDDVKEMRNYILGIIAFATAIATFLINCIPSTPRELVIISVTGVAIAMVVIGLLISRSEHRQANALKQHVQTSFKQVQDMASSIKRLEQLSIENPRSSVRTEMNLAIHNYSHDHTTILKMAQRYFMELGGDWVETDLFLDWVDKERKAGRPVNVPAQLMSKVQGLKAYEEENAIS